jgi:osmoprotectant transport system permease protein
MSPFQEQLANLPAYLGGHLRLVMIALIAGSIVSIPLGIYATRHQKLSGTILGIAGVIQTIPGLALLAIMVPLLNMIGMVPAIIALTLYSLLPILRNTVVGINEIDADIIEAGRGIGMTDNQLLRLVELPLAVPVIIAGLRTSSVWVVGIATLSTPVGATSLGNYIFSGLQTRNNTAILFGCVAAAILALTLDGIIHGLESGFRHDKKTRIALSSVALFGVLILSFTLGLSTDGRGDSRSETIKIGGKPFTEQYVLTDFLSRVVEEDESFRAEIVENLGSTVAFDALAENQIQMYVDYTGTLWNMHLSRQRLPDNPDAVLDSLKRFLQDEFGVQIAATLGFENAYCLTMRSNHAEKLDIQTISDLSGFDQQLILGGDVEFFGRPEWSELVEVYGLEFQTRRTMDAVLMYSAINNENVDVITAYTTDGRISAYDLTILDDPENVFPPYDAVILLSPEAADNPALTNRLARLQNSITDERMRRTNMLVDIQGKSAEFAGKRLYNTLVNQ